MKQEKRGGKREGSGRPPVTYKTKLLQFRVPEDLANELKIEIRMLIKAKVHPIIIK